jgi:hypothetical protein
MCILYYVEYVPSIPSFFRAFIMKECWILLKTFSTSIEMNIWFLSLILFKCYIIFIDLHSLNHSCFPGMGSIWSSVWSF